MKLLKRFFILCICSIVIFFLYLQLFYWIELIKTKKQNFIYSQFYTLDTNVIFGNKLYFKIVLFSFVVFWGIFIIRFLISIINKKFNSYTENGEAINYTSLSTKYERKKGLIRVEFNRKGEITQNTIRWYFDKLFNPLKIRYNRVLEYFKINPKHYLNTLPPINTSGFYNTGGVPLIVERKCFNLFGHYSKFWLSSGDIHSLFVGSTGRGKSITFVIAMLYFYALANENVLLNDPKGELLDATKDFFEQQGYQIITLDFTNAKNSSRWNPLQIPLNAYKKELTRYLFYFQFEEVNEELSDSFSFGIENVIYFHGNAFTIFEKKDAKIIAGEVDSDIFNGYQLNLFVQEITTWSSEAIDVQEPIKIATTKIENHQFQFELEHAYLDGDFNASKAIELIRDISNIITFEKNAKDPFWTEGAADMITGGALLLLERGAVDCLNYSSIRNIYDDHAILDSYLKKYATINSYSKKYMSTYLDAEGAARASLKSVFLNKMSLLDANDDIARILSNSTNFDLKEIAYKKTAIFLIVHDEKKTYHRLVSMFIKQLYEVLIDELRQNNLSRLPIPLNLVLDELGVMPPIKEIDTILAAARSRGIRFNAFTQSFEQLEENYGKTTAKVIEDNCTNVIYLNSKTSSAAEYFEKMAGKKLIHTKEGYKVVPIITAERLKSFEKGKSFVTSIEKKPYIAKLPPVFEYPMYQKTKQKKVNKNNNHPKVKIFDMKEYVE